MAPPQASNVSAAAILSDREWHLRASSPPVTRRVMAPMWASDGFSGGCPRLPPPMPLPPHRLPQQGAASVPELGVRDAAGFGHARGCPPPAGQRCCSSPNRSLLLVAMADEAKVKGNAAFSNGRFEEAADHYSYAITLAPENHVLYSNRSVTLASIHRYLEALADAEKTVELKPDWAKGYSRLGAAHLGLGDAVSAVAAYEKGLTLDPSNEALKGGLADAKKAQRQPEPMEVSNEEKERKAAAQKKKEAGNASYKKKDFETAIQHYTKAMELDDEDISYLTNRAAVYIEMGKYDECIKDCDEALERGSQLPGNSKMVARALTTKGTALAKLAKNANDYDIAIEMYQKALRVHQNDDTLNKINEAEKAKDLQQQLADEEREKGNDMCKQKNYPEAIKHYNEALKRNPKDVRVYSEGAACYAKLGVILDGLKDAVKCIELDPTFSEGYTRKGALLFLKKEHDRAMEIYQAGLKHDPENQELLDGIRRCAEAMRVSTLATAAKDTTTVRVPPKLNADCISAILLRLDVADAFKFQLVSPEWQLIARSSVAEYKALQVPMPMFLLRSIMDELSVMGSLAYSTDLYSIDASGNGKCLLNSDDVFLADMVDDSVVVDSTRIDVHEFGAENQAYFVHDSCDGVLLISMGTKLVWRRRSREFKILHRSNVAFHIYELSTKKDRVVQQTGHNSPDATALSDFLSEVLETSEPPPYSCHAAFKHRHWLCWEYAFGGTHNILLFDTKTEQFQLVSTQQIPYDLNVFQLLAVNGKLAAAVFKYELESANPYKDAWPYTGIDVWRIDDMASNTWIHHLTINPPGASFIEANRYYACVVDTDVLLGHNAEYIVMPCPSYILICGTDWTIRKKIERTSYRPIPLCVFIEQGYELHPWLKQSANEVPFNFINSDEASDEEYNSGDFEDSSGDDSVNLDEGEGEEEESQDESQDEEEEEEESQAPPAKRR
ncbi:unnamed protein product [Alopecurus aequalis]